MNKKKVLIIRNAEFKYNASMKRIYTALESSYHIKVLERLRKSSKSIKYDNTFVDTLKIPSETGGGLKNILNLCLYNWNIFKYLIKNNKNIDVIHAFDFDTAFVTSIYSKVFKKKYIYHIADFYTESRSFPGKLKKIIKKIDFWVIKNADVTIVCTEERINQIEGSKPKKLEVIHNIPIINNNDFIVPQVSQNKKPKNFCYIGTLSNQRFLNEMLKFFSKHNEYNLYIGGYGKDEKIVREYSLANENIIFLGKLKYEDTFNFYRKSDFILAIYDPGNKNNKYAAPNKFYESYLLRKPIIVARDTGIDKYVDKHRTGIVIDYNYDSFEKMVLSFEAQSYQTICENFPRNEYTNKGNMEKIRKIYIDLLENIYK